MSVAVAPTQSGQVTTPWEHDTALKEYLNRISLNSAPMTTYVSFEYLTILGSNMVGSLVLQSQDASGVFHYAVLPLAKGDTATNVANTGLVFMDGQDFTKLDNQIVDFKIASGTGGTAPSSCVVSFFGNGNIATLTLTNGQLGWMGASGKCTFFQTPAPPGSAPKPKAV